MKTSRFTDSQIIAVLKEAAACRPVPETPPHARDQPGDVLQMAVHVRGHGRVDGGQA